METSSPYGHRDIREPESVTSLDDYRAEREAARGRHPANPNSPIREQLERSRFGDAVVELARKRGIDVYFVPDGSDDKE